MAYLRIWSLWPNIRFLPSIVAEKNATKNVLGQTDGRTDGRTDRPTDRQTDRRTEVKQYTLPLPVERGYINTCLTLNNNHSLEQLPLPSYHWMQSRPLANMGQAQICGRVILVNMTPPPPPLIKIGSLAAI